MNFNYYRNNVSDKDVTYIKQNLKIVYNYIKQYQALHPDASFKETLEIFNEKALEKGNDYCKNVSELAGTQIQLFVRDYLLKNENELKNIYSKYKNKPLKEDFETFYTYNTKKSSTLLVKRILFIIRKQVSDAKITITKEQEYEYLQNSLKNIDTNLENSLKENHISILLQAKDFFSDYNILQRLVSIHNRQQKNLCLGDLAYEMDSSEEHPDDIGVNNLLSRENLEKMSTQKLAALNIFWQNKYAKELTYINSCYFVLQQLYNSKDIENINDTTLKNLLIKYKVLKSLSNDIYNCKLQNKSTSKIVNKNEYDYQKFFSSLLPDLENNIHKDLYQCLNLNLATQNTYIAKNNLILGTIINLANNKKLKNWGYINDSEDTKQNSIQNDSTYILIGIDYPGFNKPIRVHANKNNLQDALLNINSSNLIPIYEGAEDYKYNCQVLPTHVILPLEKRHKKFLRDSNLKFQDPRTCRTQILKHTIFLANQDKFPEHLKVVDKKGNKTRIRKYIDLYSGRTFIENGKNLVPEENDDSNEIGER